MNKILVHLRAPVLSASGYGVHARQVMDYLLFDERFVVFLENIPWGGCPQIHEQDLLNGESIRKYYDSMALYEQAKSRNQQFHISIQVTIPNEFSRRAQVNIGVTAGIEVDRATIDWIKKCNEMDLIIVPSSFSAEVLSNTAYQYNTPDGKTVVEKIEKPIHVIPEWFERPSQENIKKFDKVFSTNKNLLFVGLWGNKGGFGEDRKNISDLIRIFLQECKNNPDAGLILKTSIITNSPEDLHYTKDKIKQIKSNFPDAKCKIYLVHEHLSDAEMWGLYTHPQVQGMISLTHGEGWGLPLLEAAAAGLPVIATDWSGHKDFLKTGRGFLPVKYAMKDIPECQHWQGVMEKGSRWASVDEDDASRRIRKFFESAVIPQRAAKDNVPWLDQNFSRQAVMQVWNEFFSNLLGMPSPARTSSNSEEEDLDKDVLSARKYEENLLNAVNQVKEKYKIERGYKQSVAFMIPRSFGDCVIATSILNSLMRNRHSNEELYIFTSKEYREIFKNFEDEYDARVLEWNDILMNDEVCRRIFDYVYNPTINVQYTFSNWTLGNGTFGVKLLEEFAKHCNISPLEVVDYNLHLKECRLPKKQYISITPVSMKQSKSYKYWADVVSNLKQMVQDVEVVQLGDVRETLIDGVLDYRGRSFNETMYVVSRSILHISPDTGTAHVAGALGVPHIVLFGSTNYGQCAPLLFKGEVGQLIIDSSVACEPRCYRDVCCKMKDGKNCLSHISPEAICEAAFSILSDTKKDKYKLPVVRYDLSKVGELSNQWMAEGSQQEIHEFFGLSKNQYERLINNQAEDL